MRIDFDHGPNGARTRFDGARKIIRAWTMAEVPAALAEMESAHRDGLWLAGYLAYELGYALDPSLQALMPATLDGPLIEVGVYDSHRSVPELHVATARTRLTPVWSFERYAAAFDRVHDYIGAGDTYQINLTFPVTVESAADPETLYAALVAKQPVGYGAYIETERGAILSRSPELFFRTDGQGRVTVAPMKGTAKRHDDPAADAASKAGLASSEKDQAENLMIVDLLRNDLSRISEIGSVRVPHLFEVESYKTVHQMTSTVTAQLLPDVRYFDLFAALFPCGSITGAPKIRAMEIIRELEEQPRGIYCGAIGWIAPDGASCFNVAIRTLIMDADGRGRLNVGGGVVWDSTARAEYDEALLKADFARLGG